MVVVLCYIDLLVVVMLSSFMLGVWSMRMGMLFRLIMLLLMMIRCCGGVFFVVVGVVVRM